MTKNPNVAKASDEAIKPERALKNTHKNPVDERKIAREEHTNHFTNRTPEQN